MRALEFIVVQIRKYIPMNANAGKCAQCTQMNESAPQYERQCTEIGVHFGNERRSFPSSIVPSIRRFLVVTADFAVALNGIVVRPFI